MIKQLYGNARIGRSIISDLGGPLQIIFSSIYMDAMSAGKIGLDFSQIHKQLDGFKNIQYEHLK